MMSHKMSNTDDEEMVRLAFRTLDKDGSGSIATSEFKHLMTHIGEASNPNYSDRFIKIHNFSFSKKPCTSR
jgi:Ca2+-binding EF-hand superfamily protein